MEPNLWQVDRYRDFLEARRQLLAGSAQRFLEQLRTGTASGETLRQPVHVEPETTDDPRVVRMTTPCSAITVLRSGSAMLGRAGESRAPFLHAVHEHRWAQHAELGAHGSQGQ